MTRKANRRCPVLDRSIQPVIMSKKILSIVFQILAILLFLVAVRLIFPSPFSPTDLPTSPVPMNESSPFPLSTDSPNDWNLIWHDEFDGPAGTQPDPTRWEFDLGGDGWGNREWQYYTDDPQNASLDGNGSLVIVARKIQEPSPSLQCWYGPCKFTSARLLTRGKFQFTYGRVEARIRIPFGQGIWPAFWMLGANFGEAGWPECGEIDIMENIGREPFTVHGTVHGPGFYGAQGISFAYTLDGQRLADDFHVYAVEWEAEKIRWYLDDTLYGVVRRKQFPAEYRWVFDQPFFLLLNVAVGGNWPGYPDDSAVFPQEMRVDYVRVYQRPASQP